MPIIDVASVQELVQAITAAQAGDEIVLADGTYEMTGVSCNANGTASAPITVRAANRRQAKIEMNAVEGFKVQGAYWTFSGLDITGTCPADDTCEHAFHVQGAAHHFTLRDSAVRDFNAQLKANATTVGGTMVAPDAGLIEGNDIGDTRGRDTGNPVTKLNIDTGDDWIIRGNYLHDSHKLGGNTISYVAFLKSGGKRGLVERNLVICAKDDADGGTRIGLSFGGGGTGAQFCAPAYDPSVPCDIEHYAGTMKNNIIVNCSDVGIYLNRAQDTKLLYNTLIATSGIDFRYATTSGEAVGNVLAGQIRNRDGATGTKADNREQVDMTTFAGWYAAPLVGDLAVTGDVSELVGAGPARSDVTDDYCARTRPSSGLTLGALEHSLGACTTTQPPPGSDAGPTGDGASEEAADAGGCCDAGGRPDGSIALLLSCVALASRRRSARARRGSR